MPQDHLPGDLWVLYALGTLWQWAGGGEFSGNGAAMVLANGEDLPTETLAYLEGGSRAGAATVATILLVVALVVIVVLDVLQRRVARRG